MPDTDHGAGAGSRWGDLETSALRAAEFRLMQQVGFDIDAGLAAIKDRARQEAQESGADARRVRVPAPAVTTRACRTAAARRTDGPVPAMTGPFRRRGRELTADRDRSPGRRPRRPVPGAGRRPAEVTRRQSRAVAIATSIIVVIGLVIFARTWQRANPSTTAGAARWVPVADLIDDKGSPALDGFGPVSLGGISYGPGTYVQCDSAASSADFTETTTYDRALDDYVTWAVPGYSRFRGVAGVADRTSGPEASAAYLYFWDQDNNTITATEPAQPGDPVRFDLDIQKVTLLRMSCFTVGRDAAAPARIAVAATAQSSLKG